MLTMNKLFELNTKIYNLANTLAYIPRSLRRIKLRGQQKRNVEIKRYKKHDKCYVCGNGPSLKEVNFSLLDGDSIVVNDFFRFGKTIKDFSPTYYLVVDNSYLDDKFRERLKGLIESYPDIPYVVADDFYTAVNGLYSEKKNIYYASVWGNLFNSKKNIDFSKIVPGCRNVVSFGILLAIYLGYKEIVLLGVDYNLFATQKLQHAYEEDDGSRKKDLLDLLYRYSFATNVHYEIALYAKKHNIRIVNATEKSLLDAYPITKNYFERE